MQDFGGTRWAQRLEHFSKAVKQLQSACAQETYSDLERAGLVQIFEFTIEFTWKTLKDLLTHEGFEVKTPREAIRRAFEAGILTEKQAETLLDALMKRNALSHTYDEQTAAEAESLIKGSYTPVFVELLCRLRERHDT